MAADAGWMGRAGRAIDETRVGARHAAPDGSHEPGALRSQRSDVERCGHGRQAGVGCAAACDGIDGRWSLASSSSSSPSLLPFALASSFHSRRLLVASLDAAGRRATATVASEAAVCASAARLDPTSSPCLLQNSKGVVHFPPSRVH